jgi:hypothetical protein
VESKNRETGGFDRQSVILFADDLQEFLKGFDESLRVLEKETRERRRSSRPPVREAKGGASQSDGEKYDKPDRGGRDDRKTSPKGGRPERPRKDRPPRNSKRIVVRKK